MKSDNSIRNICIAAIKRHTFSPYNFLLTNFYEKESFFELGNELFNCDDFAENELPIAMTYINSCDYALITTRQIINCQNEKKKTIDPRDIISWQWNDFKGYKNDTYTIGKLTLTNKQTCDMFIETGKASMVIIYAIRTLVGQLSSSKEE